MGQHCPIKCTAFSSERENIVLQWAFKLNSGMAAAETCHLKGHMKLILVPYCTHLFNTDLLALLLGRIK
jgi:hypothetical protein